MTILPQKMAWWHESLIDWMLTNPDKNLAQAAVEFDVTPQWIYTLRQSQSFKDAWEERRSMHAGLLSAGISDKMGAVAEMALDHLSDKMAKQGDGMSVKTLSDVADTMLDRMGYGSKTAPQQAAPVFIVDSQLLEQAQQRYIAAQQTAPLPPPPLDLSAPQGSVGPLIEGELNEDPILEVANDT